MKKKKDEKLEKKVRSKIRSIIITTFNHIDHSRGGKELEKISAIGRGSLFIPDN